MDDTSQQVLRVLSEMRDLLRLIAEPAIAERDKSHREALRVLGGKATTKKAKAIVLMDGTKSRSDIIKLCGIDQGDLSALVKKLRAEQLLADDPKPRLMIPIPANFFE